MIYFKLFYLSFKKEICCGLYLELCGFVLSSRVEGCAINHDLFLLLLEVHRTAMILSLTLNLKIVLTFVFYYITLIGQTFKSSIQLRTRLQFDDVI